MEKKHNCQQCPLRRRYDRSPKSLLGRFWRWHINFCPAWKASFLSLSEEERHVLRKQYAFHKPQIRN
ncbi:hypothetical protein CWS33_30505 [Escherichia coli]|uniref:Uncharacterized protein n=1 Tax=Escherichia coli TaxID=562 RepID=A0AAP8LAB4_ECOLX|nr:hypothetical protein CWS33_30505 [Escherichia coli]